MCCRITCVALRPPGGRGRAGSRAAHHHRAQPATRPFEGRARFAEPRHRRARAHGARPGRGRAAAQGGQLFAVSGGFHRVSNEPQVDTGVLAATSSGCSTVRRSPTGLRRHRQPALDARGVDGARTGIVAARAPPAPHRRVGEPARVPPTRPSSSPRSASSWTAVRRGCGTSTTNGAESTVDLHERERLRGAIAGSVSPRRRQPAGVRLDHDSGSADGAANGISWTTAAAAVHGPVGAA